MNAKSYLRQLLKINQIGRALQHIETLTEDSYPETFKGTILISSRYAQWKEDKNNGLLSRKENNIALAEIRDSLYLLIDQLPDILTIEVASIPRMGLSLRSFLHRKKYSLVAILWLFILVGLLYSLNTSKKGVLAKVELQAEKLDFVYLDGGKILQGQELHLLQIEPFDAVYIPGKKLVMDQDFDNNWETQLDLDNVLHLKGHEDAYILFEDIFMSELRFPEHTDLSIGFVEVDEDSSLFTYQFSLKDQDKIKGKFTYFNELAIHTENIGIEGPMSLREDTYIHGRVQTEGLGQVSFTSSDEANSLNIILTLSTPLLFQESSTEAQAFEFCPECWASKNKK